MFFGNDRGQEISMDILDKEVGALFDRKIEKFTAKASKISRRMDNARKEFVTACNEFEKVSDEPDLEFKRWLNPNFIKSQKSTYVAALRGVFDTIDKPDGQVSYSRYSAELASFDSAINEMLGINGRNRDVIHSYSRYINHFKYLQAELEGLAANMRAELEKVSAEFGEYNDVMAASAKLGATREEIDALKDRLKEFRTGATDDAGWKNGVTEFEAKMTGKKAELEKIDGDMDKISSKIASLVLPLEKAARVYDHSSMKKMKLFDMVENPVRSLASEEGFGEFSRMVEELKEGIEKGRIDLKKPGETLSLISRIKDAKIYADLSRLELLDREAKVLDGEIKFFEREIGKTKEKAWEVENRVKKMTDIEDTIKRLEDSGKNEKAALEALIAKYYKKNIVVAP